MVIKQIPIILKFMDDYWYMSLGSNIKFLKFHWGNIEKRFEKKALYTLQVQAAGIGYATAQLMLGKRSISSYHWKK